MRKNIFYFYIILIIFSVSCGNNKIANYTPDSIKEITFNMSYGFSPCNDSEQVIISEHLLKYNSVLCRDTTFQTKDSIVNQNLLEWENLISNINIDKFFKLEDSYNNHDSLLADWENFYIEIKTNNKSKKVKYENPTINIIDSLHLKLLNILKKFK